MLNYRLIHPELIEALALSGHGSQILIADALYPHTTGVNPAARRISLNLRPGLINVNDILDVLLDAIPVEAAAFMKNAEGEMADPVKEFKAQIDAATPADAVEWQPIERFDFYDTCRKPNISTIIASGDVRPYANLLLTVGVPYELR